MRSWLVVLLHAAHRRAVDARRAGRAGRYALYAVLSGVTQAIALAIAIGMFVALWTAAAPLAIALALVTAVPFLGPTLVRHVLAPLGAVRLAHYVGAVSIASGKDAAAHGLVTGAWAQLRRPSARGEAWLEAKRAARGTTGDAEIVASGLLALARGDTAGGRTLLASAGLVKERHAAARELAAECLAAIDVEAGDFAAILARAAQPRTWPASPLTILIEGCAQRITGAPGAPAPATLWTRWALAPRRRQTRALVARAIAAAPRTRADQPDQPAAAPATNTAEPAAAPAAWPAAITAHVDVLRARRPDRAALAGAARAWDAALADADVRLWLYQRAAELAAPPDTGEAATRELRAQIAADLAELADLAQVATVDDGSAIATEIARQARGHRLATLELAFAAWEDRARARTELPPIDEWRAFLSLRASYDQAVAAGGMELRRLAFPHALGAAGTVSAWLWNQRKEHILSHAISVWLLAEAQAVGDASAIENESANCRLRVPIRSE
jgi:hypothetical protein